MKAALRAYVRYESLDWERFVIAGWTTQSVDRFGVAEMVKPVDWRWAPQESDVGERDA
jgi:hypothetical protein